MARGLGAVDRPRRVAQKVKALIAAGEKVVLADILREEGYAPSVQKQPHNVTERPTYIAEMGNFLEDLESHRRKIIDAMQKKNLDQEQYRTLSDALAKATHDVQLLSGGKTENVGVEEDRKVLMAIVAEIRST